MKIFLTNSSDQPIYDQIVSQIKNSIMGNQLKEGEALPSIRSLAKDLKISVITTKRAYDELEKSGFISTQPGIGSFVSIRNKEIVKEEQLRQVEDHLKLAVKVAKSSNISHKECSEMLLMLYEEI